MEVTETDRGFKAVSFTDRLGVACSLKESSLATESAIWFGADSIGLKKLDPLSPLGTGWEEIPLAEVPGGVAYSANTRMHLTQDQVAELLPYLRHFVETGQLPTNAGQVCAHKWSKDREVAGHTSASSMFCWHQECSKCGAIIASTSRELTHDEMVAFKQALKEELKRSNHWTYLPLSP